VTTAAAAEWVSEWPAQVSHPQCWVAPRRCLSVTPFNDATSSDEAGMHHTPVMWQLGRLYTLPQWLPPRVCLLSIKSTTSYHADRRLANHIAYLGLPSYFLKFNQQQHLFWPDKVDICKTSSNDHITHYVGFKVSRDTWISYTTRLAHAALKLTPGCCIVRAIEPITGERCSLTTQPVARSVSHVPIVNRNYGRLFAVIAILLQAEHRCWLYAYSYARFNVT